MGRKRKEERKKKTEKGTSIERENKEKTIKTE